MFTPNSSKHIVWTLAIVSFAIVSATSARAELVLVENGVSVAPIVIFEDAPPLTRRAADELAEYIERTSGARPELIECEPGDLPERAIWVGHQPVMDELFPEVSFEFEHAEEILIAANQNHLAIAGRDRWDPDQMFMQRRGMDRVVKGVQQEYGTVNAVYTFLQRYLGVRWLWPSELGEDILKQETIAFEPFKYRYHPQIRSRRGLFARTTLERIGFRADSPDQNWVRFQRLLFDSLSAPGGHAFADWWDRFHETHPDYFALQPDGTRSLAGKPKHAKLCHSNPAVWEQWLSDVEQQLESNPNRTVFNASPNDGFNSGHCVCEDCRAWDHPDGEVLGFRWNGIAQQYVALTDRHITFANTIARMLKHRYPDEDYYVSMTAYGNWRPLPVEARPDDNVIMSLVTNFHNKRHAGRNELADEARKRFMQWSEIASHIVWRPNLGFAMNQGGLPKVNMQDAIDDMRLVAEHNAIGVFFDKLWLNWATQGPHYYMIGQMTWNPHADGAAILNDYYRRGFGKASGDVKAYWQLMAETTRRILADRETVNQRLEWWNFYDDTFFDTAQAHLDRARAAVQNEDDLYRERIGLVQLGLDYTRALMDLRNAMEHVRASDSADTEAAETARAIWIDRIRPMVVNNKYPYAFNAMYIRPNGGRALRSLSPDDLGEAWPLNRWHATSQ